MMAGILIVPAGLAGLLAHPSPRTGAIESTLEGFDAFHDPQLEAQRLRLRRTLAQIAAMRDAFRGAFPR